jgi:hypothetical protein
MRDRLAEVERQQALEERLLNMRRADDEFGNAAAGCGDRVQPRGHRRSRRGSRRCAAGAYPRGCRRPADPGRSQRQAAGLAGSSCTVLISPAGSSRTSAPKTSPRRPDAERAEEQRSTCVATEQAIGIGGAITAVAPADHRGIDSPGPNQSSESNPQKAVADNNGAGDAIPLLQIAHGRQGRARMCAPLAWPVQRSRHLRRP